MKINFLGAGSAFTMKGFQTNFLIQENGKNLLIDAGGDIRFSLAKQGLSYKDIDALYLSHEHGDHCGGVETLASCTYFDPTVKDTIQLFGNTKLLRNMWKSTLSGGLKSIQGKVMGLDDYFDVNMIPPNKQFIWEDIKFEIVQSVHVMNGREIVPSYGLMMTTPEKVKVYFTGDTQFNPNQIIDFYEEADFIIQDCETYPFKSGVHAHVEELKTLPKHIKEKMLLVHINDNVLDDNGVVSADFMNKVSDFYSVACTGFEVEMAIIKKIKDKS